MRLSATVTLLTFSVFTKATVDAHSEDLRCLQKATPTTDRSAALNSNNLSDVL